MSPSRALAAFACVWFAACSGDGSPAHVPVAEASEKGAAPVARPQGPMDRAQAEKYALALVNRDRALDGLGPVVWDETAAKAADRHVRDLARNGFTAHIGTDGSVPEQRYTAAGGTAFVMENAGCFADGAPRELEENPKFTAEGVERIEKAFMDEKPPNDGHRKNILRPSHNKVGIALAKPKGIDQPCLVQEFVDDYATLDALPKRARVGAKVRVAGTVAAPAKIAGVGLSRIDKPKPMKPADLNRTGGYPIPKPYVNYFTKGFKTPIPVAVDGAKFSIDAPLTDAQKPGLYGVSVWAVFPPSTTLVMISLRTVEVD